MCFLIHDMTNKIVETNPESTFLEVQLLKGPFWSVMFAPRSVQWSRRARANKVCSFFFSRTLEY
jgi:hypothetical protein